MEKSIFKPFLTVTILMVLASLALAFTVDVTLNNIPGVVTVGIFANRPADVLLLGTANGVETRTAK